MRQGEFILAHDLGTSANKAVLTDSRGRVAHWAERPYEVRYSAHGGAEQDPEDWWRAIVETTREVLEKSGGDPSKVVGITMSSQMIGTMPVDRSGDPLYPAMIWLDARAEAEAERIKEEIGLPTVNRITGNGITSKDISAKILWLMQNKPELTDRTGKYLDCKDFLLFRLTGEYTTDWTCASLTSLFDTANRCWSEELTERLGIPIKKLPEAVPSTQRIGSVTAEAARTLGLTEGTPVICGGGDCPSAVIGSGAITAGKAHLYLGTSGWVGVSTGTRVLDEINRFLHMCGSDSEVWNMIGEMDNAGGCLAWFKDIAAGHEEIEAERTGKSVYQLLNDKAAAVPAGSEGLIFAPWIWGERAPVTDEKLRGGFIGAGLNHNKGHFIRSILEGVAYNTRWVNEACAEIGSPVEALRAIGGGATSDLWLQIISDVTGVPITQVEAPIEACARGAALTAAVGLGVYSSFEEVEEIVATGREFQPDLEKKGVYEKSYKVFKELYPVLSKASHALASDE